MNVSRIVCTRIIAAVCVLLLSTTLAGSAQAQNSQHDVAQLLRERLYRAGDLLARSQFDPTVPPLKCSCQDYCTGRCFAPACKPCPASTWSFPGGKTNCLTPFPVGRGLLCAVDPASGNVTQHACCRVGGVSCQLDPTSCCASGGCSQCPSYPPQPSGIFPLLNRTFADGKCTENDAEELVGN
jgi:hypothetical protein